MASSLSAFRQGSLGGMTDKTSSAHAVGGFSGTEDFISDPPFYQIPAQGNTYCLSPTNMFGACSSQDNAPVSDFVLPSQEGGYVQSTTSNIGQGVDFNGSTGAPSFMPLTGTGSLHLKDQLPLPQSGLTMPHVMRSNCGFPVQSYVLQHSLPLTGTGSLHLKDQLPLPQSGLTMPHAMSSICGFPVQSYVLQHSLPLTGTGSLHLKDQLPQSGLTMPHTMGSIHGIPVQSYVLQHSLPLTGTGSLHLKDQLPQSGLTMPHTMGSIHGIPVQSHILRHSLPRMPVMSSGGSLSLSSNVLVSTMTSSVSGPSPGPVLPTPGCPPTKSVGYVTGCMDVQCRSDAGQLPAQSTLVASSAAHCGPPQFQPLPPASILQPSHPIKTGAMTEPWQQRFPVLSTSSRCSVPVGTPPSMPGIVPRTAPPVMFPAPTVSHPVLDISAASHTHDTFAGHYVRPVHSSLVYTGVCPPMGSNYYQDPRSILYAENGAQPFLGPPREPLGPPREQLGPHREQLGPPREPLGPPREPLGPPREPLGPPREPLGLSQPSRGPADSEALVSGQSQLAPEPYGHRSPTPAQTTTAHWRPSCPQPQTHSTVNSMAGEFRPSYPQPRPHSMVNSVAGDFGRLAVQDSHHPVNLLQEKKLISADGMEIIHPPSFSDAAQVLRNPEVFRCTLNAIPQTSALLNKARLPLGLLIQPFKDLLQLPVIQSSVIVRCRSCRTYINPYVTFVDQRRWRCNLCYRVNDLPNEFSFDPLSKTYGDPQRRPEIRSSTIEFIAPSEYMLRPPQPAVYLFVLDVSMNAVQTGYLQVFTQTLLEELDQLPGDARTQVGFLCYDSSLYFFNLSDSLLQPQMMVVPDIDEVFLPCPDGLLVNLHECHDQVVELLSQLPSLFYENYEAGNALGLALQAAYKLISGSGGRMTVVETALPSVGPGSLQNRLTKSPQTSSLSSSLLGPASDFYKKLALDCSAHQVAVDVFLLNHQYADLATLSCVSKFSAGCLYHYPSFNAAVDTAMADKFESDLRRYLSRKIGFESVMRIRCSQGISILMFHGNFFVRSTDLLSLPNVNPDASYSMQMSIGENLTESSTVCFQAALLYTSSKGERRIRVHSLCLPVTNQLSDVFANVDQQAVVSLLSKMAVDRSVNSSLEDARDAIINACQDVIGAYAGHIHAEHNPGTLLLPPTLRLLPLLTLAVLKSPAFNQSPDITVDQRVFFHILAKTLPVRPLLQMFYPHLYPLHTLNSEDVEEHEDEVIPKAPLLQLSSANIDRHGAYLLDEGSSMYLMVGAAIADSFCRDVFDMPNFACIPDGMTDLAELDNETSERLRCFVSHLMNSRRGGVNFIVLREDSTQRHLFYRCMVEDRSDKCMSYYEFLQFLQQRLRT